MFSWINKLDRKPDHPMSDVETAQALLADLPGDNPLKALEEVTAWLDSFKDTPGFRLNRRFAVARLLDETGRQFYAALLRQYLAEPHLQDFHGMRLWRVCHAFVKTMAETYAVCVNEYQHEEKKPPDIREQMPVICVRLLHVLAECMKLDLMRYIEVEQAVWDDLFRYYRYTEESGFAEAMVLAYPGQVIHGNAQREFLCALVLHISSPDTLAPDQIEGCYRIATRMVSFFDFKPTAHDECTYFVDLAHPAAPEPLDYKPAFTADMRCFGATRAISRLAEIINQNEPGPLDAGQRIGNEFTPDGKLTLLKHLQLYWGKELPQRRRKRKGVNATIKVVHGFKIISHLVAHIELGQMVNLSEEDAAKLKIQSSTIGIADEDIDYSAEDWPILDLSNGGIGGILPRTVGKWVKIGALCGISDQKAELWWVGMFRRLHTDAQDKMHFGIEVLARKPLSVWLRILGKGTERVSNWETSSGSFNYDYLRVILLPDAQNSYLNATMLMEAHSFVPECIYEMLMGENSRFVKLTKLLEEGDDYERVNFEWLESAE
ncbi:MAG: hypothetical protein WA435_12685 [Gallionellaceae bacterium]